MTDLKNPITIYLDDELNHILNTVAKQQKREQNEIVIESLRRYLHLKMFEMMREQSLPFNEKWLEDAKKRLKEMRLDKLSHTR